MPAQRRGPPKGVGWLLPPRCMIALLQRQSIADVTRRAAETRSPECLVAAKPTILRQRYAAQLVQREWPYHYHRDVLAQTETPVSSPAPALLQNQQTECCKYLCRWPRSAYVQLVIRLMNNESELQS